MKFRFKDWVVCSDPFYQKLEAPGARESATNKRNPAMGIVEAYRALPMIEDKTQLDIQYLVNFDGVKDWIGEDFLELFNKRDDVFPPQKEKK